MRTGFEKHLAGVAESIEPLVVLRDGSDGFAMRELVLVRSSSFSVDELVAALQACEGVEFADPN